MSEQGREPLLQRVLYPLLAILLVVAVWYPLTIPLGAFLPTPWEVLVDLVKNIFTPRTYIDMGLTMRRILVGFVGSLFFGLGLGIWMGRSKLSESFFLPWVAVALAVPGPVYIIMAILILGIQESSTLVALVISVTPYVVNIIFQGVRAMDPRIEQMSRLYGAGPRQHFYEVVLPQLLPSLLAAIRTGFAMSWKLVVILEAMSQPRGIGAQIYHSFRVLQFSQILAWTLLFTLVMLIIEMAVFQNMERRLLRWRKTATL